MDVTKTAANDAAKVDTQRSNIRGFTSWPLGVAAFKLFVFSQPSASRDKGLTQDSTVQRPSAARRKMIKEINYT